MIQPNVIAPSDAEQSDWSDATRNYVRALEEVVSDSEQRMMLAATALDPHTPVSAYSTRAFQTQTAQWAAACFGEYPTYDKLTRADRLVEEVFELLQATGYPRERLAALESYVWGRPIGEPAQELGGVMITLALHASSQGLDMSSAANNELVRCWKNIEKIRAKQAAKPVGSPLPVAIPAQHETDTDKVVSEIAAERNRQITVEGFDAAHDDGENTPIKLARAAASYAIYYWSERTAMTIWPFQRVWLKAGERFRRDLVKAGALIVAAIELLDRSSARTDADKT